jgi:phosphate transport system substrate-binding protein
MGRLVKRWFAEFQAFHPRAKLDYRMYGTASAIGALATGAGNLALLGEEISAEQLATFKRAKGYAPTAIEVANGSLQTNFFDYAHMIFVHRDNPLTRLTLPQLSGILGAGEGCKGARNIRNWGELGLTGEWADKPITPYIWKTDTDFAQLLRERALCGGHRWNPAVREIEVGNKPDGSVYDLGQHLVDDLAKDRFGIAASNIRFPHPDVKPLAISWTSTGPYVQASDATLIDRSYPLGRIIPAFIDRKPGVSMEPVLREFLRFILSREGQLALIEESDYLPLSSKSAAMQRSKLK